MDKQMVVCEYCNGTGKKGDWMDCPTCGQLYYSVDPDHDCEECGGTGEVEASNG